MSAYCGGKASPPNGRVHASSVTQCARQVRAYGRRMVSVGRTRGRALLGSASNEPPRRCGARNGTARQDDCTRQVRLYGLLPVVESRSDLRRRTWIANDAVGYASLPTAPPAAEHGYTDGVLRNTNRHSRGKELVFVSVGAGDGGDGWASNPVRTPGGVGYAFGYFDHVTRKPSRRTQELSFNVVSIYVNPPYRKGVARQTDVSSWVVEKLVLSVAARARVLRRDFGWHNVRRVRVTVDPEAPCFQLGHEHHMTSQKSAALERMYVGAGFDVLPLPHLGTHRRTVVRVIKLHRE